MKKRLSNRQTDPKRKSLVPAVLTGAALVGLMLCVFLYFVQEGQIEPKTAPIQTKVEVEAQVEVDIETYVRSQLTQEDVVPNLLPAAIYYQRPDMAKEQFCAVGTFCPGPNNVPMLITAEHVFRTDMVAQQVLSVRALRGNMNPSVAYVNAIVKTGKDLGDGVQEKDIVVVSLGLEPTHIAPFSNFVSNESGQNVWGDVEIFGKKVPRMRSLVSGEYVETVGYLRRGEGETASIFILINRSSRPGESGTGYVDDFGGLWVLHAGAGTKEIEKEICAEGKKFNGKDITGISSVSGPLFGKYE